MRFAAILMATLFATTGLFAQTPSVVINSQSPTSPGALKVVNPAYSVGSTTNLPPLVSTDVEEAISAPSTGFYTGVLFQHNRVTSGANQGTGNRVGVLSRLDINNSGFPTDQMSALNSIAELHSGASGLIFALNPYVQVDSGASSTSQAVAAEFNTDLRMNINRKVGIAITDVSTSTGIGTALDSAIVIGGTGRYLNVVRTDGPGDGPGGNATDFPITSNLSDKQILAAFVHAVSAVTGQTLP